MSSKFRLKNWEPFFLCVCVRIYINPIAAIHIWTERIPRTLTALKWVSDSLGHSILDFNFAKYLLNTIIIVFEYQNRCTFFSSLATWMLIRIVSSEEGRKSAWRILENNWNSLWQLWTIGLILCDMELSKVGYIFFWKALQ